MSEEIKTKGICLRAIDYKENDRLLTLLTDNLGKITVRARGVLSPKSKLRYATQPFIFGDYILAVKNGFYTLTNFDYIDGFNGLSDDVVKYFSGCIALEISNKLTEEFVPVTEEFSILARFLMKLCYDGGNVVDLIKYVITMFRVAGYGIVSDSCAVCGADTRSNIFDLEAGGFACSNHCSKLNVRLSGEAVQALKVLNADEEVAEIKNEVACELFSLFAQYIKVKTGAIVNSFCELSLLLSAKK